MDDIIDLPEGAQIREKRPLLISIVCVIHWVSMLFAIVAVVYAHRTIIVSVQAIVSFSYTMLCTAFCVGLWLMKRWAAVAYLVACIIILIIMLLTKTWIDAAVIPIASVLVIEWYFKTHKALLPKR